MLKNNSHENFRVVKFCGFVPTVKFFLTVDYCNIPLTTIWTSAWRVPGVQSTTRYQESQGSLAVVVDQTFTSWSVDLRASLFTDNRCVILFFACLIFAVDPDRKIILTVKFSRSTAVRLSSITVKLFTNPTFSEVKEVVYQCL